MLPVVKLRLPFTVTVPPDWLSSELPTACVPVNTAIVPLVPPAVVTPLPLPAQLPIEVQIV